MIVTCQAQKITSPDSHRMTEFKEITPEKED